MARIYAGILGPLAMAVVICRGLLGSGALVGTLIWATLSLFLFALIGAIVGRLAQATVDESVRSKLEQQLAHRTANPVE